jgi:phospholipase/carboxylesterase
MHIHRQQAKSVDKEPHPMSEHNTITIAPELPAGEKPRQLFILLHGVGASAADMVGVGKHLHDVFPQSLILIPDGFDEFDAAPTAAGRQWFSVLGVTEMNRIERVNEAMPRLVKWIQAQQEQHSIPPADTALVGFSQGAIMALEAISAHDGLASRVLAFSGRYAILPERAPEHTTLHFFHGQEDAVMPYSLTVKAYEWLEGIGADATVDVASGVGHELHSSLLAQAIYRLQNTVPMRYWKQI